MDHNNTVDNDKAFQARIHQLATRTREIQTDTYETIMHTIALDDDVVTEHGSATFTRDNTHNVYDFLITLGPANAHRLTEFLLSLPSEPEDG